MSVEICVLQSIILIKTRTLTRLQKIVVTARSERERNCAAVKYIKIKCSKRRSEELENQAMHDWMQIWMWPQKD